MAAKHDIIDGARIDEQLAGLAFVNEASAHGVWECVAIEPEDDPRLVGRTAENIAQWMRLAIEETGQKPAPPVTAKKTRTVGKGIRKRTDLMIRLEAFMCVVMIGTAIDTALRGDMLSIAICLVAAGYGATRLLALKRLGDPGADDAQIGNAEDALRRADRQLMETARGIAARTAAGPAAD